MKKGAPIKEVITPTFISIPVGIRRITKSAINTKQAPQSYGISNALGL